MQQESGRYVALDASREKRGGLESAITSDNANHSSSTTQATTETTNFLMLGSEIRLPEHLLYKPAADIAPSKENYAIELPTWIETMHKMLKAQQLQLRTQDRPKALSFEIGQQVWLRRK